MSSSSIAAANLPAPQMTKMRDVGNGCTECTLSDVHVSVANAMRRILLARLPVIGIPFEPYAKCKIAVSENSTEETEQTIWYRLGNVPVHSLNSALVTDYALTIDVRNDRGNAIRTVTTEDVQLERIPVVDDADASSSSSSSSSSDPLIGQKRRAAVAFSRPEDAGAPSARQVFPANEHSGDFIALAQLLPPISSAMLPVGIASSAASSASAVAVSAAFAAAKGGALKLRATFAWVPGTGPFAPNVVGYENTPDAPAAEAAWTKKELEVRDTYASEMRKLEDDLAKEGAGAPPPMRVTEEETVANAKHDFMLTGAKMFFHPHMFDFRYEVINRAYTFERAWRQAAALIVEKLREILASVENDTLEVWPAGTAASSGGRTSVTSNQVVGGFGFDVILPHVDHSLGPVISHALYSLCFVRTEEDVEDSDLLNFCAFRQFTPDDAYGVIRLSLVKNEQALVSKHFRTACEALVTLFSEISELVVR